MLTVLILIAVWLAVAVPVDLIVGRVLRARREAPEAPEYVPDDLGPLYWRESGVRLGHAYRVPNPQRPLH